MRFQNLGNRLWHSPTLTTWASLGARMIGVVLVLPLVLKRFTEAEVALWQVFALITGFQLIADFGFVPTFTRFVAYAFGGASSLESGATGEGRGELATPNWNLLRDLVAAMRALYARIALVYGILLLGVGTFSLVRRVNALEALSNNALPGTTRAEGWVAWGIVLLVTYASLRGTTFVAFLQGINRVSLVRRWEALFAIAGIVTSIAVVAAGGRVLALVLANQAWTAVSLLRNKWLSQREMEAALQTLPERRWIPAIVQIAWPAAWKSGIGVCATYGLIQVSSLLVAQLHDSSLVASYLLGMRLVQTISQVSQAPFYSRLPRLAQLWAQGDRLAIVASVGRGMRLAYWFFVLPAVAVGCLGPWLLRGIGGATEFPSGRIWWCLVWAYFAERYGAMHLNTFALGNTVIAHVANSGAGLIFVATALISWSSLGLFAIPLGMLAGNIGFYSWYSARLSYRLLAVHPLRYESRNALPAALVLALATLGSITWG